MQRAASGGWGGLSNPTFNSNGVITCKRCGVIIGPGSPNHRDVTIVFDNKSAHITPLCADHATQLSIKDLEAIYCADMLDLSKDEERVGVLMDWTRFADRQPVGFTR